MKFVLVHPTYPPGWHDGGPVRAVFELATNLVALGHEVTVLTSVRDSRGHKYAAVGTVTELGVTVVSSERMWPWRACLIPAQIVEALRWFRWADVIVQMSIFNFTSACTSILARVLRKPTIVSPRGNLSPVALAKTRLLKVLHGAVFEKPLLNSQAVLHCTSALDLGWAKAYAPGTEAVIIPNGISAPGSTPETRSSLAADRTLTLMYMGRFHQIKNLEALLAGFSSAGLPNARLVLVGRDEHAYSDRLADIAAAIPSTTVLAFDTVDKWRLLQSADIVVLPSLSENFGNVVLEALAIGKPVLVSNTTGTSALVAARRLGVVITPSVTGLSEGIRQIVADLPELSHNARLCASEIRRTYAWSTVAEQFAHLAALLLLDRSPLRKVT